MLSENIKHISSEDIHDFKVEKVVVNMEAISHSKQKSDLYKKYKMTTEDVVKWNKCGRLSNFRVMTPVETKVMMNYTSEHEICNDPKMKHIIAPFPFNITIKDIVNPSPVLDVWTFSSIFLAFKLNLIDGVNMFRYGDGNMLVKEIVPILVINKIKRKQVRTYFEKLFAPIDRVYESGHFDSTFKYMLCYRGRPLLRSTKTLEEHEEWHKTHKTTKDLRDLIKSKFPMAKQNIEKMTKPALVKLLAKSDYYSVTKLWDCYEMPFEFESIEEVNKFKDKLMKDVLGKIYNDENLSCYASFSIGITNLKFETELQRINSLTTRLFM